MTITDSDLLAIEARAKAATQGPLRRDCGGRIFAVIDGQEMQIGEAFCEADARMWKHAGGDVLRLVAEVRRLKRAYTQPGCYQADGEPAEPCKAMFTMDTCAGCVRLPEEGREELEERG